MSDKEPLYGCSNHTHRVVMCSRTGDITIMVRVTHCSHGRTIGSQSVSSMLTELAFFKKVMEEVASTLTHTAEVCG